MTEKHSEGEGEEEIKKQRMGDRNKKWRGQKTGSKRENIKSEIFRYSEENS